MFSFEFKNMRAIVDFFLEKKANKNTKNSETGLVVGLTVGSQWSCCPIVTIIGQKAIQLEVFSGSSLLSRPA